MATRAQIEADIATYTANLTTLNDRYDAAQAAGNTDLAAQIAVGRAAAGRLLTGAQQELAALPPETNVVPAPSPPTIDPTKASPTVADGDKSGDCGTLSTSPTTSPQPTATANAGKTTTPIIGLRDWNPLGDFSSYTYKIGLYMMNPMEFNTYMSGDHTVISKFKLIAQSGGITSTLDSPRVAGFDLDLYIDDLEILTNINSKDTLMATNSISFKFKIYEPYGFSFPHTLAKASVAAQQARNTESGQQDQIVALTEMFLLTIKFYGYDKNGKLVTSADYPQADLVKSDTQSVFERAFPIRINSLKFKLENKMTVYSIGATQVNDQLGKGVKLALVPNNITLNGVTLQDALVGAGQDTTKKSVMGLVQALNDAEDNLLKAGKIEYKNQYEIIFEKGSSIGDARLVPKDYYNKERAPFSSIQNVDGSNARTEWRDKLGIIDKQSKTIEIQSGTHILEAIDSVITQSEYLKNMMTAVDQDKDQQVNSSASTIDKNPNPKGLAWYNVNTSAIVISPGNKKDSKKNDYAYKITYKISEYQIPYVRSLYAGPRVAYYGPHKRYNYWYTGKNTEILSYEQDYNFLYTVDGALASRATSVNQQSAGVAFRGGQNAVSTNSKSSTNDVINSVKSFLYNAGDLLNFKIRIIGDPDYLMPSIGSSGADGDKKWYGNDFTINPNSGQVFFEVDFQQAEDYDKKTGLLVPNGDILFMQYPDELKGKIKGMTYMLRTVNSIFSKGKFEQTLIGTVPEFVKATGAGSAPGTTPPAAPNARAETATPATVDLNQSAAETARLSRATIPVSPASPPIPISIGQGTSPTGGTAPATPASSPQPPPNASGSTTTSANNAVADDDNTTQ